LLRLGFVRTLWGCGNTSNYVGSTGVYGDAGNKADAGNAAPYLIDVGSTAD